MSVFPTAKELASWAGQCPGNDQSAGRRRSGRTRKGSKWLDRALEEAALAATRTNNVYLQAQYQRLRPRRGHKKALGAVKHSIICACWHMLTTGELYNDLGGDYYRKRDPNTPPNASSPNSKHSDTPPRSNRPWQPDAIFLSGSALREYEASCSQSPSRSKARRASCIDRNETGPS
jgi:hypothetical protein